jgi:hypothetical protein
VIILKASKVNLFVSSVLFVFWYHSPNFLDIPHTRAWINRYCILATDVRAKRLCVHDIWTNDSLVEWA